MSEKEVKNKQKKKGVGTRMKQVVSGDFLMDGLITRNLPFLLYITLLMILYVAYGYYVDNSIRSLVTEEKRAEELYSELQSLMEVYDQKSLQSKVAKDVNSYELYEAKDPPRIIEYIKEDKH